MQMDCMAVEIGKFVEPLIGIIVGVALIPVVQSFVAGANITGVAATLVNLIPFFYALAVFLYAFKGITM
jgi:hypothetical protein